jgi:hypothetical protein
MRPHKKYGIVIHPNPSHKQEGKTPIDKTYRGTGQNLFWQIDYHLEIKQLSWIPQEQTKRNRIQTSKQPSFHAITSKDLSTGAISQRLIL